MSTLTPNLIVESIEACLPFWVERLGFEKTVSVPEGNMIGFVILKRGPLELMLQSRASLRKDIATAPTGEYRACLYFRLEDLAPIRKALDGWPPLAPERKTFYGAQEILVQDPAGNVVLFSQHT